FGRSGVNRPTSSNSSRRFRPPFSCCDTLESSSTKSFWELLLYFRAFVKFRPELRFLFFSEGFYVPAKTSLEILLKFFNSRITLSLSSTIFCGVLDAKFQISPKFFLVFAWRE